MSDSLLNILIVDNHPLFLESISGILKGPDFNIKTAEGGLEAIDILDTFTPDIFFIDLIMPHINGEKLTRYIRTQTGFQDSYIVILSGIAKESDQIAIPPQADAFIAKGPMKYMAGHILDIIDTYRHRKRDIHLENFLGLSEIAPRHITKELLFSLKHLEILLDNMQDGVIEVSVDNRIVYINPAATDILGSSEFQLLSKDLLSIFSEEDGKKINALLSDFDSDRPVRGVIVPLNSLFIRISILLVREGDVQAKIILLNDVTSFKEEESKLQKALLEKEMLIREVHHRVKNNLNVISGLISIQSSMIHDESVRDILLEIQPRLQSISLVHDKLYNTNDLMNIPLDTYLSELAYLLIDMMTNREFTIDLRVNIPEIVLETDKIVILGLITTELITNAVKYGFYKDNPEENILTLSLVEKNNVCSLSIANNGKSFPEELDFKKSKKLGFQVINLLVEQINGMIELSREEETVFTITFS